MKRLNNISILRMIATVFIFISHILLFTGKKFISEQYFPFYFGVNIFLFISAILYSNKNITSYNEFFKKQFLKILCPVVFYIIIYFLILLAIDINIFTTFEAYNPLMNLWYIIAICVCYSLIPLLNKIKEKGLKNKYFLFLIFILVIEFVLTFFIGLQVCILTFSVSFLCFNKIVLEKQNIKFWKFGFLFALSIALYMIVGKFEINSTGYTTNFFVLCRQYLNVLMGISFSICVLMCFAKLNEKTTPKILQIADKYSYCFYITSQSFMVGILSVIDTCNIMVLNVLLALVYSCIFAFVINTLSDCILRKQ